MSGSGSVSFGSESKPLKFSNKINAGSGWPRSFAEIILGWDEHGRYQEIANRPGPTRTTRTHSTIPTGCSARKPGPKADKPGPTAAFAL